jgi:signal transduction histidine kinase
MSGTLPKNTAYIDGRRSEILALLAKNQSLETVLSAICEAIETIIPTSRSLFMLVVENGESLTPGAAPNMPAEFLEAVDGLKIGEGQSCSAAAAATGRVVITPDIDSDPGMKNFVVIARSAAMRSSWSQPIFAPDSVVLGTFAIYKPEPGSPAPDELETVAAFGDLASLAIQFRNNITDQVKIQQKLEKSRRETNNHLIEVQRTKARLEVQTSQLFETANELTIAREIAERASQAKTLFLSNMSHELRTPLNAIIGFSEIIKHETLGPVGMPRYAEYAADIHQAGHHLLELINEVLDFAKIEAGKGDVREEEFCVQNIVQSMVRMMSDRADRAMVRLEFEVDDSLPSLRADKRKIRQILLNLLSNAIKFSNQGGAVNIRAYVDEASGFVLRVSDTGIGMAPEDIPAALDVFGQIDNMMSRRHDGTGLGLPLTRALAEMHGGSLEIHSEVDVGTTVTVTFPPDRIVQSVTDSETPTAVSF